MLDLLIVITYFIVIFLVALAGRTKGEVTTEQYFLSSRNLRWPSIALSTIATNIQGYQFLGMMGSAYLYGLAQASLEINAVEGILLAVFIFVPLYLKEKVMTITQFIKKRLGNTVGLFYSIANILLTYLGGLGAVVKTDIIQFGILLTGGLVVTFVAIHHLGGWGQLYEKTPQLMHLHLPEDHEKLPWIHIFGLFLLNINYWCANQTVRKWTVSRTRYGFSLYRFHLFASWHQRDYSLRPLRLTDEHRRFHLQFAGNTVLR